MSNDKPCTKNGIDPVEKIQTIMEKIKALTKRSVNYSSRAGFMSIQSPFFILFVFDVLLVLPKKKKFVKISTQF